MGFTEMKFTEIFLCSSKRLTPSVNVGRRPGALLFRKLARCKNCSECWNEFLSSFSSLYKNYDHDFTGEETEAQRYYGRAR